MDTRKVVMGTMAGITLGAIGYLMYTGKGAKLVQQIKSTGEDVVDHLKSKKDDFNAIADNFSNLKQNAEDFVQQGKNTYEDSKSEIKSTAKNLNKLTS